MIRKRKGGMIGRRVEGGRQGRKNRWIWLPYTVILGFADVVQFPSCVWLCHPMDWSMPRLPVPLHLLEFAQVHVYCIGDTIQPFHPLTPSSPSALSLSQHQGLFQWVGCLYQVTKILELQLHCQSFQWSIQGWFPLRLTGLISLLSKGLSGVINSLVLCLLYGPALITIHDHWEDHSHDYLDLS